MVPLFHKSPRSGSSLRSSPATPHQARSRRGLTLIEVMVSLAAAMVVLAAVISVLGMVTKGIADSRSMIEVTGRLRSAQVLLRNDLAGVTSPGLVMQKGEAGNGYLEIIDGPKVDDQGTGNDTTAISLNGDPDDILMVTIRSSNSPFVGKSAGGNTITSPLAEVAWFLVQDRVLGDGTQVYNLHRRTFLICNNISDIRNKFTMNYTHPQQDLSYRTTAEGTVPCTLGDLGNRRYRAFHHNYTGTPTAPTNIDLKSLPAVMNLTPQNMKLIDSNINKREGEDIVLTNVLSFDVKVFDPTATVHANGNLWPCAREDRGYSGGANAGNGAYVDLGKGTGSRFGIVLQRTQPWPWRNRGGKKPSGTIAQ